MDLTVAVHFDQKVKSVKLHVDNRLVTGKHLPLTIDLRDEGPLQKVHVDYSYPDDTIILMVNDVNYYSLHDNTPETLKCKKLAINE